MQMVEFYTFRVVCISLKGKFVEIKHVIMVGNIMRFSIKHSKGFHH